jgi:hypothetical protein
MRKTACNTINVNIPPKKSLWASLFTGVDGKLAVVTIGFLLWMTAVTLCWAGQSLYDHKLAELPTTVVHLTLALGATKVTHRIAEGNWEKVIENIISIFKKKKPSTKLKK